MLQQSGRLTPPLSSNPFIFLPPPPFPLNQHLRHFWFCINLLHSAHSRACVDRWRNRFGSLQMKTTPKTNTYIHTYICSLECLLGFISMRILAQLRILLLGCGPASPFLFYFISFFFTPLHVMQFCIYLSAALAFGCCQNRVTLCARGAAALCMRLFCGYWTPMIYGRGVCVFGEAPAAGGAHGTGCLFHSICHPNLRWQAIKIAILERSAASSLIVKTPCHSTLSRQQHFSSSSKGTQRTPEVERRIGWCCSTR